jgi:hypothetical protein
MGKIASKKVMSPAKVEKITKQPAMKGMTTEISEIKGMNTEVPAMKAISNENREETREERHDN